MPNDSLRAFELSLDKFINETVPADIAKLQKTVALQILTGVVLRTPVDTGRARGNWQLTLDAPVFDLSNSEIPRNAEGRITAGAVVLRDIKPFSVTYIQNNVPYIVALEEGHSKQAPAGMVAVTFAQVEAQFSQA